MHRGHRRGVHTVLAFVPRRLIGAWHRIVFCSLLRRGVELVAEALGMVGPRLAEFTASFTLRYWPAFLLDLKQRPFCVLTR